MGRMSPEVRQVFANRCTNTAHTASMLIQTFLLSEEMISLSVADGRIAAITSSSFTLDRKSTRLNSSHVSNSYAVFCLKKKTHRVVAEQQLGEEGRCDTALGSERQHQ